MNKKQALRQRAPLQNTGKQLGAGIPSPLPFHSNGLHDDESRGKHYSKFSRNRMTFLFVQLLIIFTVFFLVIASMSRIRLLEDSSFAHNPLEEVVDGSAQKQHEHVIPRVAYFTYSYDILNTTVFYDFPEDEILAKNVRNTIALHPGTEIRFLTDNDCLLEIRKVVDMKVGSSKLQKLEDYFLQEERGMIKADVCRGAALFLSGGLYFDVDLQLRVNVWDVIKHDTEFVVPLVHKDHKVKRSFFQAFIGVTQQSQIMLRYLEYFVEYYEGKRPVTKTKSKGVVLLREAYDSLYSDKSEDHEFWQEVKFDSKLFPNVKKPIGERRACHFVVMIPGSDNVPFYSRVRGSRMCGGKDTVHKVK